MAKQAVDKSTKEMHLVTKWESKEAAILKVAQVVRKLVEMEVDYNAKKAALAEVEAMGYNYAGITYKAGKYLYLVYPSVDGQDRRREYVGADHAKISDAMAMLDRGVQRDKLKREIQGLESKVHSVSYYLDSALRGW